ncbi:hypothetical protein EON77_20635, partial [bacterium]
MSSEFSSARLAAPAAVPNEPASRRRLASGSLAAGLLITLSLGGFFYLRGGAQMPTASSLAYAEAIHHPIAPTGGGRIAALHV